MEYLDMGTKYTFFNDSIYINRSKTTMDDKVYEWLGFPLAMILLVIGLTANILLIIATRNSPRLKAPIFQLLFAIAFADMLLLLAFSLPEVTYRMNGNRQWVFGSKGCTLLVFLQFLPTHVTSCLIVVCCWERFYAVCRPHSALWITSRKMSGIIAVTWLVNGGILAPLLAMTKEVTINYPRDANGEIPVAQSCHLYMPPDVKKLYFTVMGGVFYGITTVVSIAFLVCTICKARRIDLEEYFVKDDFKNHILKCTVVVTIVSILFWIPYRYVYFYNLHSPQKSSNAEDSNEMIVLLGTIMVIVGGAVKPFIYITASSQFRKSVFRALKCCKSDDSDYEQTHGYKMTDQLNTSDGPLLT